MQTNNFFGRPIPASGQTIAYTGTAGVSTALSGTMDHNTVRLVATTDCFVEITVAGTAAVAGTGMFLQAGKVEYFDYPAASKVSAIQSSAPGNLYVCPMS